MGPVLALTLALAATADATPPPLTLAHAVAQARVSSPLRGAPTALAAGADEAARLTGRRLNPSLDVRTENFGLSTQPPIPLDVFAVVNQPIELGGKRGLRRGRADADRGVALTGVQQVDRVITLRTVQMYLEALKSRGVLDTFIENREGLSAIIDSMRRRVTEGYAAEADLLKFEAESARMDIECTSSAPMAPNGAILERQF